MYEYDVTIGRNVGSEPMPRPRWDAFSASVVETLTWAGSRRGEVEPTVEIRHGITFWQGQSEESHRITLRVNEELYPETLAQVRAELAECAQAYQQEAIALAVASSELIYPLAPATL